MAFKGKGDSRQSLETIQVGYILETSQVGKVGITTLNIKDWKKIAYLKLWYKDFCSLILNYRSNLERAFRNVEL